MGANFLPSKRIWISLLAGFAVTAVGTWLYDKDAPGLIVWPLLGPGALLSELGDGGHSLSGFLLLILGNIFCYGAATFGLIGLLHRRSSAIRQ